MDEISRAIDAMIAAVEGEMLPLMLDVGDHVAEEAREGHTYTNRTGRLQRNTRHGAASGHLRTGYRVDVVARMPYGSFVDEGTSRNRAYPFLIPAWERSEAWADHLVETTLVNTINALP